MFSKSLKRASIILIYKVGDKTVPSNNRPISLISVICKVIEKIIGKQVFSFLDQKGCLNSTQHGFRPGRSCLSALLDVFDINMHMLDSNTSVDMLYFDFSKDLIKWTMASFWLTESIWDNWKCWLFHLLTDRSPFVRLHGDISEHLPQDNGSIDRAI